MNLYPAPRLITWLVITMIIALLVLLSVVVAKAFVLEDAFIVFRSVRNFHDGFYFSAIADVRSQSFTSNIWTLLLLLGGYVSNDLPNVAVVLSLLCTIGTGLLIAAYSWQREQPLLGIMALLALAACNSFTDYSTSGLENPLAHLLLVGFIVYLAEKPWRKLDFFILSLLAGGLIANRYDQALLVLPALMAVGMTRRQWQWDALRLLIGFLPLWLWMGFAWFYYGSPFPDTYFAKMHTGVPVLDRANLAVLHHLRMLDLDFFGMLMMLGVMAVGCYFILPSIIRRSWRDDWTKFGAEKQLALLLIAGIALYNIYFFYAGGDFMAGRFLSFPMLASVWAVMLLLTTRTIKLRHIAQWCIVLLGLCGIKQIYAPHIFVPGFGSGSDNRIMRAMNFDYRLFPQNWYFLGHNHHQKDWWQLGLAKAIAADRTAYPQTEAAFSAGVIPYYAGARHRLIDTLGLSDPLLSRLPCTILGAAAHCIRNVPAGYEDYIRNGSFKTMDADLARYVDALFKIKTLPLFDWERLRILLAFSIGHYNKAKQLYIAKHSADYYHAGAGAPLFRQGYGDTILSPSLDAQQGETTANPMRW